MAIVDPTVAVVSLLRDAGLSRVWPDALARSETASMPRVNTVMSWAGGINTVAGASYVPLGQRRLQVRCYGATIPEARATLLVAAEAFKYLSPHVRQGVLLRVADVVSEPFTGREPDTDWPFATQMFSVIYDDYAAA